MDFSTAGYMGGGVALPTNGVVQTNLTAGAGDFTVKIQNAINYVGGLPLNSNGFRGVVLLGPGTFQVSNQINLNVSGVVLRGSGSGVGGTTLLMATNPTKAYTLFSVAASGSRVTNNTVNLTDPYVPSGATSFNVSSTAGYSVGDSVVIYRTVTEPWLVYIGMDTNTLGGVWLSPGKIIYTDRVIKAINGNQVTLDAPLTDSFDTNYLGSPCGTMSKYTWSNRPSQVGLEHFYIQAPGVPDAYEPIWMTGVVDAWVKDVAIQDGQNPCIIDRDAKRVTVDSLVTTHTCSVLGDPANLSCTGTQVLFNQCRELGTTSWPFVTGPNGTGPIAVLNLYSEGLEGISPHQRWTTGVLADSCSLPNAQEGAPGVAYWDRGLLGGGQGWCTGWSVAWNCVTPYFLMAAAPGTTDWLIGGTGQIVPIPTEPPATTNEVGNLVTPNSLYLAQLLQRLGGAAVENIGYPLFTLAAPTNQSVQLGTNLTFTLTVGDPSLMGNTVGLSVSGVPANAQASLSTNSVTGAGTALLTFTASNSLALGSYTLNLIGTNSGLTHTSSVVITVVNFALAANPAARAVPGGGTNTTYTLTLTTNASFSGSVNFGLSGLPANTTAAFSPTSLSGAGTATLTVTTTSNTPSGIFGLTVNGTNSSGVGVALLSLTVASPPFWTGAGGDGYWSDAVNWNGTPITPNIGLIFDGTTQLNTTNDITAGTSYSTISFAPGAGAFALNGNPIALTGNITNDSGNVQTINLGLNFSTNLTLMGSLGLAVDGGLTNTLAAGTTTLTLTGTGTLANQLSGGTNMLAVGDVNADWTLVDNAASTPTSVPWSYAINYGIFNFGTTNSSPNLTLVTVPTTTLASPLIGSSGLGAPATFNMVGGILTNSAMNIGTASGAIGNINMSGGLWAVNGQIQNANSVGSYGNINVSGGTFTCNSKIYVGNRGTGALTVSNTGYVICSSVLDVSHAYGTGSQGTVNLDGGTLAVDSVITDTGNAGTTNGSETATFNFNGGTLQALQNNATFISQSGPGGPGAGSNIVLNLIVQAGGAFINSAGFKVTNTLTMLHDPTLGASPDGGLTKLGTGTLALTDTNTYTGGTLVTAGTLALAGTGSITSSSGISIGSGAVLDVSGLTSTFQLQSGQTISNSMTSTGFIKGNLIATNGTVSVSYTNGTPALTITNGTLMLSASTVFLINNPGPALGVGTYLIISTNTAGSVTTNATSLPSVTVTDGGIATNTTGSLEISNGVLDLVVSASQGHAIFSPTPVNNPPAITHANLVLPSGGSAGGFFLTITGAVGTPWRLWSSTNLYQPLSGWTLLNNGVIESNPFTVTDHTATNLPQQFYRFTTP